MNIMADRQELRCLSLFFSAAPFNSLETAFSLADDAEHMENAEKKFPASDSMMRATIERFFPS